MTSSDSRRAWTQPVARVVAVGVVSAGIVLAADRLGALPTDAAPTVSGERTAAETITAYCPGNPFESTDAIDVTGSVAAHAAPQEALEGIVTPSEEPGRITISDLSEAADGSPEEKPTSGPASVTREELAGAVRVRATQERAPGLTAVQSLVAGGERATGTAAVPCTAPTADAWLVAGGPAKGRQERLVLTNPGGNAVTVRIEAIGAKGEESVVVPARERSTVLLDGIGGTDTAQAVHVTSKGGLIVPTIVDHHLDGLVPAGVETAGPTTQPTTHQVIPAAVDGQARGVVIGVPGERDAVVQVRSLSEDGSRSAAVETVAAGSIADIELPEVPGVHSWVIDSDEPVVAAAHTTVAASDGTRDMAWSVATQPFGTLGGVALPPVPEGKERRYVAIAADGGPATAEVLVRRDGEVTTEEVTLEEGSGVALPVHGAEAVWVRPSTGAVHAAVLVMRPDDAPRPGATSIPLQPSRVAVRDIEVVHQR